MVMAITYDKKALRKFRKQIKQGSKKTALKASLIQTIIWFVTTYGTIYLFLCKEDSKKDIKLLMIFIIISIIMFISNYYISLKNFRETKALYNKSIKYFQEHDPSYLDDLDV